MYQYKCLTQREPVQIIFVFALSCFRGTGVIKHAEAITGNITGPAVNTAFMHKWMTDQYDIRVSRKRVCYSLLNCIRKIYIEYIRRYM